MTGPENRLDNTVQPQRTDAHPRPAPGAPANIGEHQLAVAMAWGRRGQPVVPCSRTDKRPLIRGFGRDATPEQLAPFYDPGQIEAWWTGRQRRAHVGILTRHLVVIDLDIRKPGTDIRNPRFADYQRGADVLQAHIDDAGADWPVTYTAATPSGGRHLYFRQPTGQPIGCATGDGTTAPHLGPLIDVRGMGGLVIAPGSFSSAQGVAYSRISPPELLPQELPDWLLQLLRPPVPDKKPSPARQRPATPEAAGRADRYAAAALDGQVERVAAAHKGDRWRALTGAAFRLGELAGTAPAVLNETDVKNALLDAATAAGMNEHEAERTIRTAWTKATRGTGAGA
jgi:hypothetical protein